MEREYSYIYGFADEIKDNWKDTLLNCFYIGKQSRKDTEFFRGYEHLDRKKDKNYQRFRKSQCFVIAEVPPIYNLSNVEKYFTELIKPELNILNNPNVNGKKEDDFLCNIYENENLIDRLEFYVFDRQFLTTDKYFDIYDKVLKVRKRDNEFANQKIIPFNTILDLNADDIFDLFGSRTKLLVEGTIKERILIYGQKFHTCELTKCDGYANISSSYNNKTYHIYHVVSIGNYEGHTYQVVLKSNCARKQLDEAKRYVRDYPNDVPLTDKELENLVIDTDEYKFWYGLINIKFNVLYTEPAPNTSKTDPECYKSYQEGNKELSNILETWLLLICGTIRNEYLDFSKQFIITKAFNSYKDMIDETIPRNGQLLYYLGILNNIFKAMESINNRPKCITMFIKNPNTTIFEFYEKYKNSPSYVKLKDAEKKNDIILFQSYTDSIITNNSRALSDRDAFVSTIDVPWAMGYLSLLDEFKRNKEPIPYWVSKNETVLMEINNS